MCGCSSQAPRPLPLPPHPVLNNNRARINYVRAVPRPFWIQTAFCLAAVPWDASLLLSSYSAVRCELEKPYFSASLSLSRSIALPATLPANLVVQIYPDIRWQA